MKPLIGVTITADSSTHCALLHEDYLRAIRLFGGIALLLPPVSPKDVPRQMAPLDGLLLTGGGDFSPLLFGRDASDKTGQTNWRSDRHTLALAYWAFQHRLPTLGICRGLQAMALSGGGSLCEDILSQTSSSLCHSQISGRGEPSHRVFLRRNSRLFFLTQKSCLWVNSFHHQCVVRCGAFGRPTAFSADGLVEAMETEEPFFYVGVQWHPERMLSKPSSRALFQNFLSSCEKRRRL